MVFFDSEEENLCEIEDAVKAVDEFLPVTKQSIHRGRITALKRATLQTRASHFVFGGWQWPPPLRNASDHSKCELLCTLLVSVYIYMYVYLGFREYLGLYTVLLSRVCEGAMNFIYLPKFKCLCFGRRAGVYYRQADCVES